MAKRRTSLGAVGLEAISAKIDRKKLPLREQLLKAERRAKREGITKQAAMIAVARDHIANQPKTTTAERRPSTEPRTKLPLRPKRPRDPFFGRLNPKKTARKGGRQPRKR